LRKSEIRISKSEIPPGVSKVRPRQRSTNHLDNSRGRKPRISHGESGASALGYYGVFIRTDSSQNTGITLVQRRTMILNEIEVGADLLTDFGYHGFLIQCLILCNCSLNDTLNTKWQMSQAIRRRMIAQRKIRRLRASRKFTPHRGQASESAPTVSLQLGHFRRVMDYWTPKLYCL